MWEPKGAQLEAMRRSRGYAGFGYFMEQGLGKTSTTYGDFLEHAADGMVDRMVTLAPNSFKGGWADEVDKFGFPITPVVFESGNTSHLSALFRRGFNTRPNLIINYEAIRSQSTLDIIADFARERNCYIAADESIKLKDPGSDTVKAALQMVQQFKMRRILSGKPMSQGPHDLWAQMRFLGHLQGKAYYPFKTAFCKMGGFKMKQVVGAQNEEILAQLIDPWVFRATKAEWTDLPPKLDTIREYTLTPEMKSMYRSMEEDFVLWLNENEHVSVDIAISKYIKLAQIQAGFIIRDDGSVHMLVEPKKNPRLNALEEYIEGINGKVIVVYNHKVVRPMLYERFAHLNPAHICGGMTPEEIKEHKRRFNEDKDCRVIFITKAAKYGHTLLGLPEPGHHCSDMVFYENTYSLDDRSQLEDRNHRYGQLGETNWYADIVGTPIDRAATRALQRKEGVFQAVFKHIGGPRR
jgi:hypothetical protein